MGKGLDLEKRANAANLKYRKAKKALIMKVAVPIVYTSKGLIAQTSTVDYAGVIEGGKFIAFDAKECMKKTSFPLSNIKQHQLNYLTYVEELGGIGFFLVHFKALHKDHAYITPVALVNRYRYEEARKSIPIKEFKEEWLVPIDDYLINIK